MRPEEAKINNRKEKYGKEKKQEKGKRDGKRLRREESEKERKLGKNKQRV
jgi:hypothetical protein